MMSVLQITTSVKIDSPVGKLYAFLAVPTNHVFIHPYITEVRNVKQGLDKGMPVTFDVVDSIPLFGGISFPVVSRTEMTEVCENEFLRFKVSNGAGTPIESQMRFEGTDGQTTIIEQATLKVLWLFKSFVQKRFIEAHRQFMDNLKSRMEGEFL